jgi:NAD-dependent DNA ligase
MSDSEKFNVLSHERIDDRQVAEIIGIAHGIIADGVINQAEVEYLQKWLAFRAHITGNPVVRMLQRRIDQVMADGIVDVEEAADLMSTLSAFAGGDFEAGELIKSTSLPLCDPVPSMQFEGASICFTGTFNYGNRKQCEAAVETLGSIPGSLTLKTRYLVIGVYATESWRQSAFGRKIETAVELRSKMNFINIVGETHWIEQMRHYQQRNLNEGNGP